MQHRKGGGLSIWIGTVEGQHLQVRHKRCNGTRILRKFLREVEALRTVRGGVNDMSPLEGLEPPAKVHVIFVHRVVIIRVRQPVIPDPPRVPGGTDPDPVFLGV